MINQFIIYGAKYLFIPIPVLAFIFFLRQPRDIQKQIVIFGIIVLPAAYLLARLISMFYYDPRPFVEGHFIPLIQHAADNGFPSDHTLISASVSAVIFPFNKKLGSALWFLTALVALSRVLSGIHHIADVLGSIVIVLAVASLSYLLLKNRIRAVQKAQ